MKTPAILALRFLRAFALLAAVAGAADGASAARHVALVIGNDAYQALPPLNKAVADAGAYADLLRSQGFDEVMLRTDLTRGQMDEAIAVFLDKIGPGDTAVFAYSGHGWSDGTQNYIVGTDAPATGSQEFLARISVPLRNGATGVIDDMDRRGAAVKVAIIDACRDNPFTPAAGGRNVGVGRGLVRIDPPRGTFVVFSASPGQVALDRLSDGDADPNSVFTRVFVPLVRRGISLQDAVKQTQTEVVALARSIDHDQQPAYTDEMLGATCLSGNCQETAAVDPDPAVATPTPTPPAADNATEIAFWTSIASSTNPADFEAYLRRYPEGAFVDLARNRMAALQPAPAPTPDPAPAADPDPAPADDEATLWAKVLQDGGANGYEVYLKAYPDGRFAGIARTRLAALSDQAPQPPADALPQPDSYWRHNGSLMALYSNGAERVLRYVEPREGLAAAGVSPGDILFVGEKQGNRYRGTAYIFSQRCGRVPYDVAGTISRTLDEVVLTGDAPRLGDDCAFVASRPDRLVFTYVGKELPGAVADRETPDAPADRDAARGVLRIPQTFQADLDLGAVQGEGADVWFQAETRTALFLTPQNGALIARDAGDCSSAFYEDRRIPLVELPPGTSVCVRTDQGRTSQLTIDRLTRSPRVLVVHYATLN